MCCIGQTPAGTKNMTYYTKQQSCKPRRRIVTFATAFMLYNSLWQVVRKGECSLTTSRDAIHSSAQDNQCLTMLLSEFFAKVSDVTELWYYFIKWFLKPLSSDGTDCDGIFGIYLAISIFTSAWFQLGGTCIRIETPPGAETQQLSVQLMQDIHNSIWQHFRQEFLKKPSFFPERKEKLACGEGSKVVFGSTKFC